MLKAMFYGSPVHANEIQYNKICNQVFLATGKIDLHVIDYYALSNNYPNPFNPVTTIQFSIPNTSDVSLKIYNMLGIEVATLIAERLSAGVYTRDWNASNRSSGVYFYRLQAGSFSETKKLILLK